MVNQKKVEKIIIKISSNLLNPDVDFNVIKEIAKDISILKSKKYRVIIVTSGAVMHGIKILKYESKPNYLPLLQATAAVGQIQLMTRYQSIFKDYGLISAQILVSIDDFKVRKRYLNLRNTIESLLEINAIPIINENDSINTEELKFGDNDHLSSLITLMMDFDILMMLTDVNGLYDKDPNKYSDAKLITNIEDLNEKYLDYTSSSISKYTSGGMKTKIESAIKVIKAGVDVFIGNGFKTSILKILDKKETGTYIKGSAISVKARKKWLGFSPTEKGDVFIDEGAWKALQNNYSLLASGISEVNGNFSRGSLINVIFSGKKVAQGLTNYSSKEIDLVKGKKSSDFNNYLKSCDYKEVIHKNNLFLL